MNFNTVDIDWGYLLERLEHLLDLGEELLTRKLAEYPFDSGLLAALPTFRWQHEGDTGYLQPIAHPDLPEPDELFGLDAVVQRLRQNTLQFLHGAPANHVLLQGAAGSGKAAAIKSLATEFAAGGLRLVELAPEQLWQLPALCALLRPHPYRFILFCPDLSHPSETAPKIALRTLLGGGLEARPDNLLLYATCSNDDSRALLAESFGLVLDIPALDEGGYLAIVQHLAARRQLPVEDSQLLTEARSWAALRGRHSGRLARQFVDDVDGRLQLTKILEN